jgi:tight adherence protein B
MTFPSKMGPIWRASIASLLTFLLVLAISSALVIASAFALLIGVTTYLISTKRNTKFESERSAAWPEVIDHLISGIQSGLSITESLSGLADRGPHILRPYFLEFRISLRERGDFSEALAVLKATCGQHGSDQIFEAVSLSRTLGGAELLNILRTVGTFLRQDLALRREIDVKHGWIKNSAHLSAAAPWLLLLLLSTQPSTAVAFSTSAGVAILFAGLIMTTLAYLWMNHLGKLPQNPRVFFQEGKVVAQKPKVFGRHE